MAPVRVPQGNVAYFVSRLDGDDGPDGFTRRVIRLLVAVTLCALLLFAGVTALLAVAPPAAAAIAGGLGLGGGSGWGVWAWFRRRRVSRGPAAGGRRPPSSPSP